MCHQLLQKIVRAIHYILTWIIIYPRHSQKLSLMVKYIPSYMMFLFLQKSA